jgi:hypothetical protein
MVTSSLIRALHCAVYGGLNQPVLLATDWLEFIRDQVVNSWTLWTTFGSVEYSFSFLNNLLKVWKTSLDQMKTSLAWLWSLSYGSLGPECTVLCVDATTPTSCVYLPLSWGLVSRSGNMFIECWCSVLKFLISKFCSVNSQRGYANWLPHLQCLKILFP